MVQNTKFEILGLLFHFTSYKINWKKNIKIKKKIFQKKYIDKIKNLFFQKQYGNKFKSICLCSTTANAHNFMHENHWSAH